ncbi:sensor histidine kinase [Paractinoplanes lichenicola]|uniref:histidine kinase n=1 Tax=Paractinoplanes lichenicola TaxID=2802976 RepID=A0ABS1VL05_9ACTN|nr:histidine kinase [Actinoplanes lichenicola]MBL7255407.1 hypothetical protein [Actinoplanes lichenicola]
MPRLPAFVAQLRTGWATRPVLVRDGLVAVLLALLAFAPPLLGNGTRLGELPVRPLDALAVAAALAMALPLALRRLAPALTLAVVAAGFGVQEIRGYASFASIGVVVALYSTAAHQPRFRLATAGAAVVAYGGLVWGLHSAGSAARPSDYAVFFLCLCGAWVAGSWARSRRRTEAERRRLAAAEIRAAERSEIARELHDVVTHHVTAIVVQAGAAQFLTADPARTTESLTTIADTGRRALTELRDLLGVLDPARLPAATPTFAGPPSPSPASRTSRSAPPSHPSPWPDHSSPASHPSPASSHPSPVASHPSPASSHPSPASSHPSPLHPSPAASHPSPLPSRPSSFNRQPGISDISLLIDRNRASGQPVELIEDGQAPELSEGRQITAYRVVQESLTNAMKYATGGRTVVRLGYRPDGVHIEVTTEPVAVSAGNPVGGSGRGLAGLRERVEVFGGELTAGPRRDRVFAVNAHIPAEASS